MSMKQINYLHGLRAIAALTVVLGHCNNALQSSPMKFLTWMSVLCVPLFICLSGFLLTLPIVDRYQLKRGVLGFLEARANRIIPAFIGAIVISLLVAIYITHESDISILATAQFWQTLFMVTDFGIGFPVFNGPLWSLPVEFHIYFTFPILVWGWRRFGVLKATTVACVISIASWHWLRAWFPMTTPYLYTCFYFGTLAAWIATSQKPDVKTIRDLIPWSAVSTALFVIFFAHIVAQGAEFMQTFLPNYLLWGAVASVGLVALSVSGPNQARDILQSQGLVAIGTISYSLYLLHSPLLSIIVPIVQSWKLTPLITYMTLVLIELPTALVLASISYYFLELPYLKRKSKN